MLVHSLNKKHYHSSITIELLVINLVDIIIRKWEDGVKSVSIFFKNLFALLFLYIMAIAVLPIVLIGLYLVTIFYSRLAKKINAKKHLIFSKIDSMPYEKINTFHDEYSMVSEKISHALVALNGCENFLLMRSLHASMVSINQDLTELKNLCISKFTFNKNDFKGDDTAFKDYLDAFRDMSDIWDYETPESDKIIVFDIKRKQKQDVCV